MKFMCVATPLLAAMVMGLPADAGASARRSQAGVRVEHARAIARPDGPTILSDDHLRQAVAQQPSGSVRRPPPSGGGGSGSGGGSGGGGATTSGGRSGGGGDSGGGGAVTRGEARRPVNSNDGVDNNNRAVPRGSVRPRSNQPYPYYYYRPNPWYYDRWGYGGFGLGYFYYSPWSWYGPGPGYGYGGWGRDDGGVRLKVKPRDAEVLVDGYYAGTVDDFDGNFQSLKLDAGSYRIEVRKPGFESLSFDVRVQRDRTITFRGDMKAQP